MSVASTALLEPLKEFELPVDKRALVVGGGVAGMTSAFSLANQGFEVYLVEKDKDLGGMARRLHRTLEGLDVQAYLNELIRKVYRHPSHPCHDRCHHHGRFRLCGEFRHQGELQRNGQGNPSRGRHHCYRC